MLRYLGVKMKGIHEDIHCGRYIVCLLIAGFCLAWTSISYGAGRPDIVWQTNAHDYFVGSVAFSPDGTMLASAGGQAARLWRVSDGALLRTFSSFQINEKANSVAFSSNGSLLAIAGIRGGNPSLGQLRVYHVSDGSLAWQELPTGEDGLLNVTFSPDGRLLAFSIPERGVRIRSATNGMGVGIGLDDEGGLTVAFSPDSSLLLTTFSELNFAIPHLWSTLDGASTRTLEGHSAPVYAAVFSPDGQFIASGGADTTIRLWKTSDGSFIRS